MDTFSQPDDTDSQSRPPVHLPAAAARPWLAVAGVIAAAVVGFIVWDRSAEQPPPMMPALANVSPTPTASSPTSLATEMPRVVSIVGQVLHPGLVTLQPGARIHDAVLAAGGVLPGGDSFGVNLAQPVEDGMQIVIGAASEVVGETVDDGVLNLNSASAQQLENLNGVGPKIAEKIVAHREKSGPFTDISQLTEVNGIGAKFVASLEPGSVSVS